MIRITRGRRTAAILLALVLALDVALLLAPRAVARPLLEEGGPIESVSAVLYLLGGALLLLLAFGAKGLRAPRAAATVLLLVCGARELDFHDRFTSQGISRLRFYTSSETPLVEKLTALLVLGALVAAAIVLFRAVWRAVARSRPLSAPAVLGVVLLPVSVLFDRLVRLTVYDRALDADATLPFALFALEETMELAAPLLLFAAVLRMLARSGRAAPAEEPAGGRMPPSATERRYPSESRRSQT